MNIMNFMYRITVIYVSQSIYKPRRQKEALSSWVTTTVLNNFPGLFIFTCDNRFYLPIHEIRVEEVRTEE